MDESHVGGEPGEHGESEGIGARVEDVPVLVVASRVPGGETLPVGLDAGPEGFVADGCAGAEAEGHDGDGVDLRVGPDDV